MSPSNPDRRRIALHAGAVPVDLELPAGVPIAALIPAVVDLAGAPSPGVRYRLHPPGLPALDGTKTLAEHGIRDGTVLMLSGDVAALPAPRFHDDAEQVAAAVRATLTPWTARTGRLAGALAGSGLAGVAGFVAVPGGPGAPNALLAAAAAAAMAVLTAQFTGASGPALIAVCGLAIAGVAAALAAELTGVSVPGIGALVATAALAVQQAATRLSLAGLSRPDPGQRVVCARNRLCGLIVAGSAVTTLGSVGAVSRAHLAGIVFAATAGAALLCQARTHLDRASIAALIAGGIGTVAAAVIAAGAAAPQHRLELAALSAALAAGAVGAGSLRRLPAAARRGAELLEYATLVAVVPLAGWVCGWFDAVRALSLG